LLAEVNQHGAWFMIFSDGKLEGTYATVNGAADAILRLNPSIRSDPSAWASFKDLLSALRGSRPGTVDCFHSAWPIVWYDRNRDECLYEVDDYEEWEEAWRAMGRRP
jgi:hypothetical protein